MLRLLFKIFGNQNGAIGVVVASIVSAVADMTGDPSSDAQVKILREINKCGPSFCLLTTNWPFLRTDISFDITSSAYTYSGSSYIPETFKRVVGAHLVDSNSDWHIIKEVGIRERYDRWLNPNDNQGRPKEFVITRPESAYYEIQFSRLPDETYTFKADIEQKWVPLTAVTDRTLITDEYFGIFSHYVAMNRARNQGDFELYAVLSQEWTNPRNPKAGLLERAIMSLSAPLRRKGVRPPEPQRSKADYDRRIYQ